MLTNVEFNNPEGKDMLETTKTKWKQVCEQLLSDPKPSSHAKEKAALLKIEKNVYSRKTASPVVIAEL